MKDTSWIDYLTKQNVKSEIGQLDGLVTGVFPNELATPAKDAQRSKILHPKALVGKEHSVLATLHRKGLDASEHSFEYMISLYEAHFSGLRHTHIGKGQVENGKNYAVSDVLDFVPEMEGTFEISLISGYEGKGRKYTRSIIVPVFPSRESLTQNPLVLQMQEDANQTKAAIERMTRMIINPSGKNFRDEDLAQRVKSLDNQIPAAALYLYLKYGSAFNFYADKLYRSIGPYIQKSGIWVPS